MVRIQLETGYLEVKEGTDFPLNFGVADIRDVSKRSGVFSKSITLVGSANNNTLLNHYYDVNIESGTFDINALTKCAVLQNDIPVLEDCFLQLVSVNKVQHSDGYEEQVEYTVVVKDAQADFFTKLDNKELEEIDLSDFDHTYSSANVVASFTNTVTDGYVYPLGMAASNSYQLTDFRPAIYAKVYWDRIHANAGFGYTWSALSEGLFDKLVIPYNGDKPKVDYSDYLVEETKASFTATLGAAITNWTEVTDAQGLFNPTTGVYSVPFYVGTGSTISVTATVDIDVELVNATGANAYLVDMLNTGFTQSIEYRPKLQAVKNGTTVITTVDLFPPGQTPEWETTDNPLPNGTTTLQTIQHTATMSFSSVLPTDTITFQLIIQKVYSQPAPWLLWKDAASTTATTVTITEQITVTNIDIDIVLGVNLFDFGQTVELNNFIPRDIKQKDFIKSICLMYNLFVEPDPDNANNLIYKSRDAYYDDGSTKNWTLKLAKDKAQSLQFLPELSAKKLLMTYTEDTDNYNATYTDATDEIYGQLEYTFENEYVKGIDRKELIFSPTPSTLTPFNAVVGAINGSSPRTRLRILIHNGVDTCDPYNIYDYASSGQTNLTEYPRVLHFDDPYNPTFDINFGVCDFYFYDNIVLTNNNLFNLYWRRTIAQIDTGKMLTAYFDLREADIQTLRLSDKIRIDNSYWTINRVIDYNPNKEQLTKVELMSVDTEIDLPRFRDFIPPPLVGQTFGLDPSPPLIDEFFDTNNNNGSPGKTIVKGVGNTVVPGVTALVLGDNGYIDSDGIWLNGEKIAGADESEARTLNVIIVDGAYTADPTYDELIVTNTATTITVPDARNYKGKQLIIKNKAAAGITTVTSAIASQIDGKTNWTLPRYNALRINSDGAVWNIT